MKIDRESLEKAKAAVNEAKEVGLKASHVDASTQAIADFMANTRRNAGINQSTLAAGLDIGRAQIANTETARTEVPLRRFIVWCYLCDKHPVTAMRELLTELGLDDETH